MHRNSGDIQSTMAANLEEKIITHQSKCKNALITLHRNEVLTG